MANYIFSRGLIPNIISDDRDKCCTNKIYYVIIFIIIFLTIFLIIFQTLNFFKIKELVKALESTPSVKECLDSGDIKKLKGFITNLNKLEKWNLSKYNFFGYKSAKYFEKERKKQFCQIVKTIISSYDIYLVKVMEKCYEYDNNMIGDCKYYRKYLYERLNNLYEFLDNSENKKLDSNWPYLHLKKNGYTFFCGTKKDFFEKSMPEIYYWYIQWQHKDILNKEITKLEIIFKY